jgi:hypothetical protein
LRERLDAYLLGGGHPGRRSAAIALAGPGEGIVEDIGSPLPFEAPFRAGEHPVVPTRGRPAYPLPFHPVDLGEAVPRDLLGFVIEGRVLDANPITPGDVDEFMRTRKLISIED